MTKKPAQDTNIKFSVPNQPIVPTMQAPQSQKITIEQAMKIAEHHQQKGNLQQAEQVIRDILQAAPNFAPAIHLLGVVAYNAGKEDIAIDLIKQAISINDKMPLFHANIAEMYRRADRFDEAVEAGEKAINLDPEMLFAQSNLGIAYFDLKEYDKAEQHQKIALALNPNFAPSLNNMGSILRNKNFDYKGAAEYFRKALAVDPTHIDSQNNLGEVLTRLEDPDSALTVLNKLLKQDPRNESAWCNRGTAFLALGNGEEAKNSYIQAISINNESIAAYAGLIMVALEFKQNELGEECAEKLLAIAPEEADAHGLYAALLFSQGKTDEAEIKFQDALAIDPDHVGSKTGMGNILMERGDLKGAEEMFTSCVGKEENAISSAIYSLIQVKKIKEGMPEIEVMEKEAEKLNGKLIDSKAISLGFALGKMYDDLGQYDKGFPYYIDACKLKRKSFDYSTKNKEEHTQAIKDTFTKEYLQKNAGHGNPTQTPIFVLGMPRSGTTLTEQIIASHPNVFGAGELKHLINMAKEYAPDDEGESFGKKFKSIAPEEFEKIGTSYLKNLMEHSPDSNYITDKMPGNFHYIGIIKLALPNAKIIHIKRHPLDNCISCFTRLFATGQAFSYDLEEAGHYYRIYDGLMDHWRNVLDEGDMHEVQYEALVDNTEEEARKLIDYCGLEWDESCLEFYKNKRSIRTASVTQVRQPIYKSSKQRWKNYDQFIDPLKRGLGDVLKKYE